LGLLDIFSGGTAPARAPVRSKNEFRANCVRSDWAASLSIAYVRDQMGRTNVKIMIPFVRTLTAAEGMLALLATHGLKRGENDLQVVMMCELPSNAVLAEEFLDYFDGSLSGPTT
jgi:pyruvate,water dikinase